MQRGDSAPDPGEARDLDELAAWAPELAQTFAALACDIALVVDASGVIANVAQAEASSIGASSWVGQHWTETAEPDSSTKLQALLDEVAGGGPSERHEVNHRGSPTAAPVAWRAVRLGRSGPVLAAGQDLRMHAQLQQRFLKEQEALERSYWQARLAIKGDPREKPVMTARERQSLGLAPAPHLDDAGGEATDELKLALDKLHARIGKDSLQGLLRDVRQLAEQQFLYRALLRAGSLDALASALGISRRTLLRRGGAALRSMKP